jgi:hypothetical protein
MNGLISLINCEYSQNKQDALSHCLEIDPSVFLYYLILMTTYLTRSSMSSFNTFNILNTSNISSFVVAKGVAIV